MNLFSLLKSLSADKGRGKAMGVFTAIKGSFEYLGITDFRPTRNGVGTDSASVNCVDKEGAISMFRKEIPWLYLTGVYCTGWN